MMEIEHGRRIDTTLNMHHNSITSLRSLMPIELVTRVRELVGPVTVKVQEGQKTTSYEVDSISLHGAKGVTWKIQAAYGDHAELPFISMRGSTMLELQN